MTVTNRWVIIASLLVGGVLAVWATREVSQGDSVVIPSRFNPAQSLEPTDVVSRQLDALQSFGVEDDACKWCYQFAAPSNRAAIGSPERFASLMQQTAYSPLLGHRENLVGKAMIVGEEATVLCSILAANGRPAVFRFVLSRQVSPPFKQCWMTTAVYRMDNYSTDDLPAGDLPVDDPPVDDPPANGDSIPSQPTPVVTEA